MKKYGKIIAGVLLLAALIGGSTILYRSLSREYRPDNLMQVGIGEQVQAEGADADSMGTQPESADNQSGKEAETAGDAGSETPQGNAGETEQTGTNTEETVASQEAPDFTVINGEEESVKLSDMQGKPVVLNFWASWCGPCKSEMPMFQEMYDTYGEDITFLMVNLTDGSRETVETAQAYIGEQGYTFPVYFDVDQEAAYAYYVNSIPTTYFIDAEGNLAAYGVGAMEEESFLKGLEMLGIITK
ncbi:MAG: TlpA family protein disulfide reductase [Lachnospiraceae bacterium]